MTKPYSKKVILRLCAAVVIMTAHSEYAHAQYETPNNYITMPLSYSPATTGLVDGTIRANAMRDWRWVSVLPEALTNTNVTVDMPLLRNRLTKGNAIGVGVILSESNYNYSGWLSSYVNTTKTYGISAAYHKAIDKGKKHHLSLGLQYMSSSSIVSDKPYTLSRSSDNSTNVGLLYSGIVSQKLFLYGGISLKQNSISIRSANEGMLETSFGGNLEISKRVGLLANFTQVYIAGFYRTQGIVYTRITLTSNALKANNRWAVYAGMGYSVDDAILPYLALEYGGIRVGVTTDNMLWQYTNGVLGTVLTAQYVGHLPKRKKTTANNNWNVGEMF